MTVLTNEGRAYLDDLRYGRVTDPIDTIAVGVGDQPESIDNETLDQQVYVSDTGNANVRFSKVPNFDAATYGAIDLHGGTEVPGGTEITELGVMVGAQDVLVWRDVKAPVVIEPGLEVTLRLRMNTNRV